MNPKPFPEIYFKSIYKIWNFSFESLVLEDSSHGRQAAISSGANLMPIKQILRVSLKNIKIYIKNNSKKMINISKQWEDNKLNVLVPMAGAGKRFADAGYTFPKPLIEIDTKPMIHGL